MVDQTSVRRQRSLAVFLSVCRTGNFYFWRRDRGYQRLLQSRRCRSQHILATRAFSPNRGGPPRRQISMHCWNPSGFQVGKAGSEFAHANLVIFLDSNLRIAKWIYGTDYSSHDVDLALKVAAGESDWIGQHSQLVYALLLFAGSILCVAFSYYLLQLRLTRRASRTAAAN